jgi:hypothetical protein
MPVIEIIQATVASWKRRALIIRSIRWIKNLTRLVAWLKTELNLEDVLAFELKEEVVFGVWTARLGEG